MEIGDGCSNPLEHFFYHCEHRMVHKQVHYFDIYHRYFERYQGRNPTVVEFGVRHGGSLQMWKDYFGPGARIVGVDIDPRCKELEEEQIEIYIGDQEDRGMLARLRERVGRMDVIVDDGGHTMVQQRVTFEELYPCVPDDGVYLVEDVHSSYWPNFGGGYRRKGTFIEYAKDLVDQLNAWGSHHAQFVPPARPSSFRVNEFTRRTRAIHFYDAVVVFERGKVLEPHAEKHGEPSLAGKRRAGQPRKHRLHQRVRSKLQRSLG